MPIAGAPIIMQAAEYNGFGWDGDYHLEVFFSARKRYGANDLGQGGVLYIRVFFDQQDMISGIFQILPTEGNNFIFFEIGWEILQGNCDRSALGWGIGWN